MSTSRKCIVTKVLFALLFGLIVCFYSWSNLFITSLLLLVFADCISTQYGYQFLKRKVSQSVYSFVKYTSYFMFAIGLAIFCRVFIFEIYSIPSSSMENTLSEGDLIVINKLRYGPKMPNSVEEVPFGRLVSWLASSEGSKNPIAYTRLSGFHTIQRNDIIVFKSFKNNSEKKFIKRIIGLPGETLQISASKVSVDGTLLEELPNYVFNYVSKNNKENSFGKTYSNTAFEKLPSETQKNIERDIHQPNTKVDDVFPKEKVFEWNRDYYGPVTIPKKEITVELNPENAIFYKESIALETQQKVTIQHQNIYISDSLVHKYTFQHNYFFVMGDNRHFSRDSRAIGFVPEYTIQGKLWFRF
ncbi:MAG: signal peptidase I [Bacteroidota bacterium]